MRKIVAPIALAATVLWPSAALSAAAEAPEAAGVFRALSAAPAEGVADGPQAARVAVDFGRLAAARRAFEAGGAAALELDMGGGWRWRATVAESAPTPSGGYALSGDLDGVPGGTLTLVVGEGGGALVGTVRTPDAVYAIRPSGGAWLVEEAPRSLPFIEGAPLPPPPAEIAPKRDGGDADDDSEIDMLIVWTPAVRRGAGSVANVREIVELFVAETNGALRVSDAATRINLVAAVEVDYEEVEGDAENVWLQALTDLPNLGAVRELSDAYAADLAHLLVTGDTGGGRGYVPGEFAVTGMDRRDLAGYVRMVACCVGPVFAHETGHNLGLWHDRYANPNHDPDFDGFGYTNQRAFEVGAPESARWLTLMASIDQCRDAGIHCKRPFRFSNSRQDHLGDPLGVAKGSTSSTGPDGPADAVRHIGEYRHVAANRRASAGRCEYRLSPAREAAVPRDGGEVAVRVEAPPSCEWTARVHDDWLSLASAARGVGEGEVRFRTEANPDSDWREGGFSVAGEMLAVRQGEPAAAFVSVCDRSPWMRDYLTAQTGRERCEDVGRGDLGGITRVKTHNSELGVLRPDDFSGLVNLRYVELPNTGLTSPIPPELGNWSKLWHLDLFHNELSGPIPPELGNLDNLEYLSLAYNRLSGPIPPEIGGLANLKVLYLDGNDLSGPIPPTLGSLRELEHLYLRGNALTGCIPEALFEVDNHDLDSLGLPVCGPPAVVGLAIESRPTDGRAYGIAERIVVAVRFDQDVAVSGTPRLAVRIGGRTRWARFAGNRGGGEIVFSYDVALADRDADGIGVAKDALALNSGAIRYPDGPDADLSLGDHAIANAAGHRVRGDRLALADGAATVELSRLFPDGSESYAATAGDPGELRLSVADGVLSVTADEVAVGGSVRVTVTATGPDGEALSASFTVDVPGGASPGWPSGHWWEVLRERLDRE